MRIAASAIGRFFCFCPIEVGRDKPPACHFCGSKRRSWNDRCPYSVTLHGIASCAVVIHRQHGFVPKHFPVIQFYRRNRAVGRTNDCRNGQRADLRLGWIFIHHGYGRPRTSSALIRFTRCWSRKKTPHRVICQWGEAK